MFFAVKCANISTGKTMLKIYNDKYYTLRTRAEQVALPLDEADKKLALAMLQHIKESQDEDFASKHKLRAGVGLAAPQVGVTKRMLVVHFEVEDGDFITHVLVNPRIIANSVKKAFISTGEGCLSVDEDYPGRVYRSYKITVDAYDVLKNKQVKISALGYEAIVLQHEIDHLNGVLFYDHINPDNITKYPDAVEL